MLTVMSLGMTAHASLARDVKIGFNGDLSASPSAQSGQAAVLGMQAAVNDINANGGVLGRKLALVLRDDLSQPPKSIQNMSDLIDNEGVVAVFGPTNSGNAMAWKHIVNQKKIPVLDNVSSGTDITAPVTPGADNYMFRVSMVDREQIAALMAYVKKSGGAAPKVGFMAETTGYGQGGLRDMKAIAEMQGVKPVDIEQFGVGDTDMTSQLNKLKAAGVDTVLIWAQGTPIAQVMRSMEKINYYPRTLSSWAADNITFYDAAGKTLAEKLLFLRTVSANRTPAQDKLFARIGSQLKAPSSFSFALHGYDSVLILAQAIKQANSTEGSDIRVALENLRAPVQGLLKTYIKPYSKLNHEALVAKDLVWVQWKDGKLVPHSDAVVSSLTAADFRNQKSTEQTALSLAPTLASANADATGAFLQALISGLAIGGAYALVALGFSITFTTTKTLNFSHGEFVSTGAFIGMSAMFLLLGKPITATSFDGAVPGVTAQLLALVAALVVMGALGWLLYVVGVRPFARKPGMAWVMSTLGFGVVLDSIGLAIWGPKPVVVPSPLGDSVVQIFGVGVRPQELLLFAVAIVVMFVFDLVMRKTMVGKVMRAVAANGNVASLMGINTNAVMIGAFVVRSTLAGLSGFLIAPISQASLYMGLTIGLKGFSGAMIGGLNNPRGCVIGGFVLGVFESTVNLWQAQWREIAVFAVVILVLAFRPTGLFGSRLVEKV
jgi:branched-chain amino acid transport system substrate-binding protein